MKGTERVRNEVLRRVREERTLIRKRIMEGKQGRGCGVRRGRTYGEMKEDAQDREKWRKIG